MYIYNRSKEPMYFHLKKKKTGLISVGDQVPTCPVFTRAKIKSRLGILVNLPSHYNETKNKHSRSQIYGNGVHLYLVSLRLHYGEGVFVQKKKSESKINQDCFFLMFLFSFLRGMTENWNPVLKNVAVKHDYYS